MSSKIEALLDEAFSKHHSTKILAAPFDPAAIESRGARVAGRSPAMGFIAAVAVMAIAFVGITHIGDKKGVENTSSLSGEAVNDRLKTTDGDTDEQFDQLMQTLTVCGERVSLPITVGRLKEIADVYNIQPCGQTGALMVFKDKTSGEICFIAYTGNPMPLDEHIVKEIYVGSGYAEGAVTLDGKYVGMQSSELISKTVTRFGEFYLHSVYNAPTHCTITNKLGYYVDFEIEGSKIAALRIVLKEAGADTENAEQINAGSVKNTINIKELELHTSERPVYTYEEAQKLIDRGVIKYERAGRKLVDTDKYVSGIKDGSIDKNSLEGKSYIYHMMLNSIDYFNSAEGKMTYAFRPNMFDWYGAYEAPFEGIDYEFQTDMQKGSSYERVSRSGEDMSVYYVSDLNTYIVDPQNGTYRTAYCGEPVEFIISDNDRFVTVIDDTGEQSPLSNNRNDLTHLGVAGSSCLFPQSYAIKYLFDFDSWSAVEITEKLGRECVYIEGTRSEQRFNMTVDLKTGIMLECNELDDNGSVTDYVRTNEINIDEDIKVKEFDKSKYSLED